MKKLLSFLLIFIILSSYTPSVSAKDNEQPHLVLIYMAQNYEYGSFDKMYQSGITDFVILSLDDFGYNFNNYIDKLLPRALFTLLRIIEEVPNANIWIGTPHMSHMTNPIYYSGAYDKISEYMLEIKDCIGKYWDNVSGIYMNTEAVIYDVDYNNLTSNCTIEYMNNLSYMVHTNLKKKFLWIPYYGYGDQSDEIIKKIGYITNTTAIFDYVILQPHYYFSEDARDNLRGVFNSCINNSITYIDGTEVVPRTTSSTAKVGFLMEITSNVQYVSMPELKRKYGLYKFYYIGLRNIVPSGYYTGGALEVQYSYIKAFYLNTLPSEQIHDYPYSNYEDIY